MTATLLTDPIALDEVADARHAAERDARVQAAVAALAATMTTSTGAPMALGESRSWRRALGQAVQVAATDATVLLLGESGTGKEVVAQFVHRGSARKGGPFVALNCAALPEHLLEAELFGYERGAYTGATQSKPGLIEMAAGGTLFLDEVAEMSPPAQAKFLRVLQEREFQRLGGTRVLRADVRIIAATHADLPAAIARGRFREDLYYRLNVFAIRLPALRERRQDIPSLCDAFVAAAERCRIPRPAGISREAMDRLHAHHWPGNIRELRNVIERASILCDGGVIVLEHLDLPVASVTAHTVPPVVRTAPPLGAGTPATAGTTTASLALMEREMLERALHGARFNKVRAAKAVGITRHQLYGRLRKHGLLEGAAATCQ